MIDSLLGNIDEGTARKMLNNLDDSQIKQGLQVAIEDFIVPHIDEIQHNANEEYESRHDVRELYNSMSDAEQQETFDEAWGDMVAVCAELRNEPQDGSMELKRRLRDPWTMEALLLIFNNDDHIDPEYSDEMKEFVTFAVRWMSIQLLPEMYSEAEIRAAIDELFDDVDYEQAMEAHGVRAD